ncbi:MAG: hypothetical protein F6K00_01640 [Leptolyngbya sp. SIOISBB]|nr:hypothetical protein [Leptolyngbya sp. SIOISBB]
MTATTELKISGNPHGGVLHVQTPERYAMDIAIDVLKYLDESPDISVKDTGWKQGFGLEVSAWIPIDTENVSAELMTDGDECYIRRSSGSLRVFTVMFEDICQFLIMRHNARLDAETKAAFE